MKKVRILIALLLLTICQDAFAQEITMFSVLSLAKTDIKKSGEYLVANKWKLVKTVKVEVQELTDPHSKYAHFTNCFFMLPEYKRKFKTDPHNTVDGVFRQVYIKSKDSIFLYYYNISQQQYPAGLLYKTNRVKLDKITEYLKHNKYSKTFTRDSTVVYEIKKSVENVTIDKSNSPAIEYYIDRCWKYADMNRRMEQ